MLPQWPGSSWPRTACCNSLNFLSIGEPRIHEGPNSRSAGPGRDPPPLDRVGGAGADGPRPPGSSGSATIGRPIPRGEPGPDGEEDSGQPGQPPGGLDLVGGSGPPGHRLKGRLGSGGPGRWRTTGPDTAPGRLRRKAEQASEHAYRTDMITVRGCSRNVLVTRRIEFWHPSGSASPARRRFPTLVER